MKTRLKCLLPLLLSLFVMGLSAQEPFFFNKEGLVLNYANKDAKGKITSYSETTVTKVEGSVSDCTIAYKTEVMDAKKKPLLQEPIVTKVTINGGTVKFDPMTFAGQVTEGMEVTGESFLLPANISVGQELKDYAVTVAIGPVKTSSAFSNIKVTAAETLDIGGTAVDCFVVESTVLAKVIGIKQEMKQKIWYARGLGSVKMETYNKKDKLQNSQELIAISGK